MFTYDQIIENAVAFIRLYDTGDRSSTRNAIINVDRSGSSPYEEFIKNRIDHKRRSGI
jgi:hypothetical protein